ncbi:MAG: energy-coupling factor transporter ATP-binding protein [Microbacteriaceae bacterium]|jgi:energy-coupling factor transport system ATP-binding protein|nr:energy-coupling factor transporter ATP-binding protein [Microbacteriaceae bacterium]
MSDPIIRFDDVTFTYAATDEPALHSISLDIQAGEYVAILGLNGAGKTTLGLCVNGVIPTMLGGNLEGKVTVAGLDVSEYPVREMAKIVGMVFDNPEFQMSQMSVAEEVALGLENAGVPYEDMKRIIPETLELVGLAGFEERSPLGLSGGQQQRLAIAAVLAMQPQVLIMDEPTSNLDPIGKQEVFDMAAKLNRERGMTVIVIEHEVEVMARYADRVIVLDSGRVVMNGTPQEIFSQVDALGELKLRVPEAARLAQLLAKQELWSGPVPIRTESAVEAVNELLGAHNV